MDNRGQSWTIVDINKDGRFVYREIHCYFFSGIFSNEYSKFDKQELWKRAEFFQLKGAELCYISGQRVYEELTLRLVVEDQIHHQQWS